MIEIISIIYNILTFITNIMELYHSIIGGGLSALIRDQVCKKSVIFFSEENKIIKSEKFYESLNMGGNTKVWGGYINYRKFSFFLKNKKFENFFQKQKIFKLRKLFADRKFQNTYYLSYYNNKKIFRIKKKHFKNPIISKKIEKIIVDKKKIFLFTKNKKILTKKVSLCVGNLSLIKLLYDSNILNSKDQISFDDGKCNYQLNFLSDISKNYLIQLTFSEIISKIINGKYDKYNKLIKRTFLVQAFSINSKSYKFTVDQIMKYRSNNIRYFLSNHIANLRVNNIPIDQFIKKFSNKIKIYNSGIISKYIPGPISQNIIFNAVIK